MTMDTGDDDEAPPLVQTEEVDGSVDARLESQVGDLSLVKVPITIVTGEWDFYFLRKLQRMRMGGNMLSDDMLRKRDRHFTGRVRDARSPGRSCG